MQLIEETDEVAIYCVLWSSSSPPKLNNVTWYAVNYTGSIRRVTFDAIIEVEQMQGKSRVENRATFTKRVPHDVDSDAVGRQHSSFDRILSVKIENLKVRKG